MRRVILTIVLFISGCAPAFVCDKQTKAGRLAEIEHKHGVVIEIKDFSNQRGLCELLEIIEKDLEICPQYFKDNIGPILIEKSFNELSSKGIFLVGYVNMADTREGYPVHIKSRSVLEKVLFPVPRENNVFLHKASHSFELNIKDENGDKKRLDWKAFCGAQAEDCNETGFLGQPLLSESSKPASMSNVYGGTNHFEDFAEPHCYLRRNNIELIKDKYPTLYRKCKLVERFTDPRNTSARADSFGTQIF
jgi:hypothetical protein